MSEEKPPEERIPSPQISSTERGLSLVFAAVVLGTLIFLVLAPRAMDNATLAIVRFLAATFAGIAGYLFSGNLGLEANIPLNKTQIRAAGGFAAFVIVLLLFFYGVTNVDTTPPSARSNARPKTVSIRADANGASTERDITVRAGTMVTITAVADSPLREIYTLTVATNAPDGYTVLKSCDEGLECSITEAKSGERLTYYGTLGSIGGTIFANSDRKITVTWLPR